MSRHGCYLYLKPTVFFVRYSRTNVIIEAESLLRNVRPEAEETVELLIFNVKSTYCNSPSLHVQ